MQKEKETRMSKKKCMGEYFSNTGHRTPFQSSCENQPVKWAWSGTGGSKELSKLTERGGLVEEDSREVSREGPASCLF